MTDAIDARSPVVVVGAAILDESGRLLSARRSAPSALAGGWEFPGGKVEQGETDSEALHREIREELGVTISIGDQVGKDWLLKPGLVLRLWICRILHGVPEPLEDHDELRWLAPAEWGTVAWLPADWPVVDGLARHMGLGRVRRPADR